MSRLPPVDEQYDPELAAVLAEIAGSRGWVSNVMRALAHAPEGLRRFASLGDYARYHTKLSDRSREIVILITGRGVPYAWTHHAPLGRQAGLSDSEVEAIRVGRVPDTFSNQDTALVRLILEFTSGNPVSAPTFAAVQQVLSPREITDALLISAFYVTVAMVIGTIGVELEPPDQLNVEQEWQRQQTDRHSPGSAG